MPDPDPNALIPWSPRTTGEFAEAVAAGRLDVLDRDKLRLLAQVAITADPAQEVKALLREVVTLTGDTNHNTEEATQILEIVRPLLEELRQIRLAHLAEDRRRNDLEQRRIDLDERKAVASDERRTQLAAEQRGAWQRMLAGAGRWIATAAERIGVFVESKWSTIFLAMPYIAGAVGAVLWFVLRLAYWLLGWADEPPPLPGTLPQPPSEPK